MRRIKFMMRKITLVVLALVLGCSTVASAQQYAEYKQALAYELKFGLVFSDLATDNYETTSIGTGWTGGVGLFLPFFTARFGFQADLMYIHKKSKATISDPLNPPDGIPPSQSPDYEFTVDYVELPLMVQWAFTDDPDLRAYLLGGMKTALNTTAKVAYRDSTTGVDTEADLENVNTIDWGPIVGIGFKAGQVITELRYAWSVTPLNKDEEGTDARLNNFTFLIGFSF
jgi:hypothetical protein